MVQEIIYKTTLTFGNFASEFKTISKLGDHWKHWVSKWGTMAKPQFCHNKVSQILYILNAFIISLQNKINIIWWSGVPSQNFVRESRDQ